MAKHSWFGLWGRRAKPSTRPRVRSRGAFEPLEPRWLFHGGDEPHNHAPASLNDHIHAQLSIFVNGTKVAIPASIGMSATDFLSFIHTHDAGGLLHVHPINGTSPTEFLTLGDFFDTWRTTGGLAGNNPNSFFDENGILGNLEGNTHIVRMYVNGVASDDFEDYVIHEGDDIVISYLPRIDPLPQNSVVTIETNLGPIPIELFGVQAPQTVANFLNYVNDDDYVNSIIHRLVTGFVVQGGGFTTTSETFTSATQIGRVPVDPPVVNEPGISNTRGTVAMAKQPDLPNSATSQFFVNVGNNASNLDQQNGGFTVFGRVLDMTVVDVINSLSTRTVDVLQGLTAVPMTSDNRLVVVESVEGDVTVRGVKFADLNSNGTRDTGEPGLAGQTVFVDANNNGQLDTGESSTTTAVDGSYSFRLAPGTHNVRDVLSAQTQRTTPASGVHTVTLDVGESQANLNFGVFVQVPVAAADRFLFEGASFTAPAPGVLANDTSVNGPSTAELVAGPTQGTLALNPDGSFTYTPGAAFDGLDSFSYRARNSVAPGAATTAVLESESHRFVAGLFNDLLGRTPTEPEVQTWHERLRNGGDRGLLIRDFRATPEHRQRLVNGFYQEFLNRQGEQQGLDYWVGRLGDGDPEQLIAAGFVNSPEYFRLQGNDNDSFLLAAYDDLADTLPDNPGRQFWQSQLDGGADRLQVITSLINSQTGRAEAVDRMYSELLGRPADAAGREFWLERLGAEEFLENLAVGLLSTDEYVRSAG